MCADAQERFSSLCLVRIPLNRLGLQTPQGKHTPVEVRLLMRLQLPKAWSDLSSVVFAFFKQLDSDLSSPLAVRVTIQLCTCWDYCNETGWYSIRKVYAYAKR